MRKKKSRAQPSSTKGGNWTINDPAPSFRGGYEKKKEKSVWSKPCGRERGLKKAAIKEHSP